MPHNQPVTPVTSSDGHRFDLIHAPARDPKRTLLLIPGMGLSARQYIPLSLSLAERGIEIFIHEWRGIGSSNKRASRSENWNYHELLDVDLNASLAAVNEAREDRPVTIAGHSLGSQFTLLLAARQPALPDSLIVLAGGSPHWTLYPLIHRSVLLPVFFGLPMLGSIFGHYPGRQVGFAGREARSVMKDWTWTGRHGHYDLPSLDPNPSPGMAELSVPILGVRMADDWFVPKASLDGLLAKAPRCSAQQVVINQLPDEAPTDHFAWLRHPQPVAEVMESFLSKIDGE